MSCAVVVFTKTPELSDVKTRLAKTIGVEKARDFYSRSLEVTQRLLFEMEQQIQGLDVFWAIAEKEAHKHPRWRDCSTIFQGQGGLGERLAHVYSSLLSQYKNVCFMGGDSPHIHPIELRELIQRSMKLKGFLLAPTHDGGFYFFSGHEVLKKEAWTSVEYSQQSTCSDLAKGLGSVDKVFFAADNFDIDDYSDLKKFANYEFEKEPLSEQIQLKMYARKLLLT